VTPERITKTQRWLDLLAFLLGRRTPATVDEIFGAVPAYGTLKHDGSETSVDSVRRMFERDKDELRSAGIPIETEQFSVAYGSEPAEGYRLRSVDFYLPDVGVGDQHDPPGHRRPERFEVAPEDLGLTLDALRAALAIPDSPFAADTRSALRKLSFDLDTVDDQAPVLRATSSDQPDLRDSLHLLSDALLRRKRVSFSYRSASGERHARREVAPHGVMFEMGAWYLVGHDELRDDIRVFRVDRMEKPTVNRKRPGTADYEIPEEFSLETYRDRQAWQWGLEDDPGPVRVRFSEALSMWAERNRLGRLEGEGSPGSTVRVFDVQRVEPLVDWVLSLDGRAVILDPPEVASRLRAKAEAVRDAHSGETRDDG